MIPPDVSATGQVQIEVHTLRRLAKLQEDVDEGSLDRRCDRRGEDLARLGLHGPPVLGGAHPEPVASGVIEIANGDGGHAVRLGILRVSHGVRHPAARPTYSRVMSMHRVPPGYSEPANERTGWKEGEDHHELWGPAQLWLKREKDGWTVPASDLYKSHYSHHKILHSEDWAVFTIHIDSI